MPKAFDFSTRKALEEAEFELTDPSDPSGKVGIGVFFTISSVYSKEAREAATNARAKLKLVDGKIDATDADWDENLFEQTVSVMRRWRSEPDDGHADTICMAGEYLPCTPEAVRSLFGDPQWMWAQKQTLAAYLDIGRFFPTSKAAS